MKYIIHTHTPSIVSESAKRRGLSLLCLSFIIYLHSTTPLSRRSSFFSTHNNRLGILGSRSYCSQKKKGEFLLNAVCLNAEKESQAKAAFCLFLSIFSFSFSLKRRGDFFPYGTVPECVCVCA
ncbi:uncharacterized protein FA14DRAFT_46417 [Meira miltonrushii]|uniref:Uncharacterized protein n=1 Tax=Meira miltonrushii TaxID=1280837 RepID=A0A316VDU9_9BASI|nr:uncharacterized protein FA14DRAFT_46417 [Meira miltonrushii]PWN35752.1 hypothetical protein FA14DRAFT_46417 [Meira miltonrushii]